VKLFARKRGLPKYNQQKARDRIMKKLFLIMLTIAVMLGLTAFGSAARHDQGINGSDRCEYVDGICIVCEWALCTLNLAPHEYEDGVCVNCGRDIPSCAMCGSEDFSPWGCAECGYAGSDYSGDNGEIDNNGGNSDNRISGYDNGSNGDNPDTGIKLVIIPALLAGGVIAAMIIARKKK
jgi:hypothetical protein